MSIGTTLIRRIHVLDGGWQEELPSFEEEYGLSRVKVGVKDGPFIVGDISLYMDFKRAHILTGLTPQRHWKIPEVAIEFVSLQLGHSLASALDATLENYEVQGLIRRTL